MRAGIFGSNYWSIGWILLLLRTPEHQNDNPECDLWVGMRKGVREGGNDIRGTMQQVGRIYHDQTFPPQSFPPQTFPPQKPSHFRPKSSCSRNWLFLGQNWLGKKWLWAIIYWYEFLVWLQLGTPSSKNPILSHGKSSAEVPVAGSPWLLFVGWSDWRHSESS